MAWIIYFCGLIFPWVFYLSDLLGNNFDAYFSEETRQKLRVKDESFLRKIILVKEGNITKRGEVVGYRYYLCPRVLALFIQSIIGIVGLVIATIHLIIVPFIPHIVLYIIGGVLLGLWAIYTLTINILAAGFKI